MKSDINPNDEIEVVDENNGLYARVRVREYEKRNNSHNKASIFLTPEQLIVHAQECVALAENMKGRR